MCFVLLSWLFGSGIAFTGLLFYYIEDVFETDFEVFNLSDE
uniref:Uncharacterized protein n=1 Tax=viral metagenome TaxID=1070528 RepID=A0A6C0JHK8_9ZZZZ